MIDYSFNVYKRDGRVASGERFESELIFSLDECEVPLVTKMLEKTLGAKYRVEVNQLYVTKKNLMTGKEYQERFDTPYFCSPSSESFWSM